MYDGNGTVQFLKVFMQVDSFEIIMARMSSKDCKPADLQVVSPRAALPQVKVDLLSGHLSRPLIKKLQWPLRSAEDEEIEDVAALARALSLSDQKELMRIFRQTNPDFQAGNEWPVAGTLLTTACMGFDKLGEFADGSGGSYHQLLEVFSATCGWKS